MAGKDRTEPLPARSESTGSGLLPRLLLLVQPGLRHPHRNLTHALDHADALGHADRAARIERVKDIRALEHLVIRRQQREALLLGR